MSTQLVELIGSTIMLAIWLRASLWALPALVARGPSRGSYGMPGTWCASSAGPECYRTRGRRQPCDDEENARVSGFR
jgi:hypothetical protein